MKRCGAWLGSVAALGLGSAMVLGADSVKEVGARGGDGVDPYLWLEDVHGAKALEWVKAQDARAAALLQADPDYQRDYEALLRVMDATDRIPFGDLDHQFVFNFWQDAQHSKGIWRRVSITDYRRPAPDWELLLDLDRLAADEHENWVWKGADCAPSLERCLLSLSRGGGDAVVVREFDLRTRTFLSGGFTLTEAKATIPYLDDDTVLVATDFGPGSMTTSGYPRIVKLWRRGRALASARTIYEGKVSDVGATGVVFRSSTGTIALVERDVTFFTAEFHALTHAGATRQLPLPLGAVLKSAQGGQLIFTLREDWTPDGGAAITKGSLIAYHAPAEIAGAGAATGALAAHVSVLMTPDAHSAIDEVVAGRDAVYASIYRDVTGSIHAFRAAADRSWSDTVLPLPAGGSTQIVSANAWGPEAMFRFESFTIPTTLYADTGDGAPQAIKSLPARFDASHPVTEQFFAEDADGTRAGGALRLRRVRGCGNPALFAQLRPSVAQPRRGVRAGEYSRRR